mmetsp:Transcript_4114/g.11941  ORF Transcript_4114/g.11941 Transcript_4114/m.11941 type:complete len:218 (-) Transcript_4114:295-948(-)
MARSLSNHHAHPLACCTTSAARGTTLFRAPLEVPSSTSLAHSSTSLAHAPAFAAAASTEGRISGSRSAASRAISAHANSASCWRRICSGVSASSHSAERAKRVSSTVMAARSFAVATSSSNIIFADFRSRTTSRRSSESCSAAGAAVTLRSLAATRATEADTLSEGSCERAWMAASTSCVTAMALVKILSYIPSEVSKPLSSGSEAVVAISCSSLSP